MSNYTLIFDDLIKKQLQKLKEHEPIRAVLSRMFDAIEERGVLIGKCIDLPLHLYEMKAKSPPVRLYFKQIGPTEILLFEFELKTSPEKQRLTIAKLKWKIQTLLKTLYLSV